MLAINNRFISSILLGIVSTTLACGLLVYAVSGLSTLGAALASMVAVGACVGVVAHLTRIDQFALVLFAPTGWIGGVVASVGIVAVTSIPKEFGIPLIAIFGTAFSVILMLGLRLTERLLSRAGR